MTSSDIALSVYLVFLVVVFTAIRRRLKEVKELQAKIEKFRLSSACCLA